VSWTAVVPLKTAADRKTRLSPSLDLAERIRLSDHMARQVIATLKATEGIGRVLLLSPAPPEALDAGWLPDRGAGLNAELTRVRVGLGAPILVIHADLPLLVREDIELLLNAANEKGVAIAPDRHGEGTNAVALADARPFRFAFGPGSFRAHSADARGAVVRRPGLSLDIDSPEDLQAARAAGLRALPPY